MFFRADVEKSGSGIGLYIVKEALENPVEILMNNNPEKALEL